MANFCAHSVLQSRLLPGLTGVRPLPQVCHIHKRPRTSSTGRSLRASPAEEGPKETTISTTASKPWAVLEKFIAQREPAHVVEPLARTFLLGVAAGTLVEVGHVMYKFLGLLTDVGTEQVLQVFPSVANQFSPLFYVDHAAAFAAWFVLYSLEMVAVTSLLEQNIDQEDYTEELSKLRTLSKKLLPIGVQSEITKMLLNLKTPASAEASQIAPTAGLSPMPSSATSTSTSNSEAAVRPISVEAESPQSSKFRSASAINPPKTDANEPAEEQIKRRRKEIEDRKSFLRNFWYTAALSENVGKEPFPVEILGMKLVLYRGEDGEVRCLRDSCPHRSAPLSDGSITNIDGHNCLVCPYHGWAIDDNGCIQDVPSEKKGQWPRTQQVENYVVEERGGFIWLFYEGPKGNRLPADERPPIPCIPELDDPNWTPVYGELEFDCGHWAVFENAIDMAHIHYLHNDSFGNDDKPVVMNMEGTTDAFGVTTTFNIHNKPVSPLWNFTAVESVPVVAKAMLPSTSMIQIELGMGIEFITFVCTVPISENKCVNRFALIRNFLPWAPEVWEPWARNAMFKILGEDKVMIETLRPEETLREVSVRADLPQILFRKLRQEYIDMGYGYRHQSYDHSE